MALLELDPSEPVVLCTRDELVSGNVISRVWISMLMKTFCGEMTTKTTIVNG